MILKATNGRRAAERCHVQQLHNPRHAHSQPSVFVLIVATAVLAFSSSNSFTVLVAARGVRPTASHELPVIDLIESPDKIYDPKPDDLNADALLEKLGKSFDTRFMSVHKPLDTIFAPNGTMDFSYGRNKKGMLVPIGKMPKAVRKLKFKFLHLPNGRKVRTKVTQKLRRKLRQFLWAYTYCPVVYVWKDLGLRFWPRWLREGRCYSAQSCSFPEGMTCQPNKSMNKLILRWHCQDWDQAKYCKWIPVRYPVITGCSCSC